MEFRVVCISRTLAAGGEDIGQRVAQRLGFRYVDEQIITRAARQAQVDPALVAAVEHRQPLLKRLLAAMSVAGEAASAAVSLGTGIPVDAVVGTPTGSRAIPDDLRTLIRAAIIEVATAGRAVIVAHAASLALANMAGVLRVLVTASPSVRIDRWAAANAVSAAAADAVAASDRERREYFQRFYNIKEELPTHYDVVINTDVLSADHAVNLIVAAVQTAASA